MKFFSLNGNFARFSLIDFVVHVVIIMKKTSKLREKKIFSH
jgi:hypothetical protein